MWRKMIFLVVAGAVVPVLVVVFGLPSGFDEIADESTRFHLNLFGSSIYEYHTLTGKWPAKIEDLAKTFLPQKSPLWRQMLDDELDVIVWHNDLKLDPKKNADQILVYHNKGLISQRGQSWVCRGDLRTEYIRTEELQAYLKKLKE